LEEMCLDEQQSIIDDFEINIHTMASMAILIGKLKGSNCMQWSGEMALLLEPKQVYGIVMGEDERPEDLAEDATAMEELGHLAAVKDRVKQHGAA
jgi:hypothetical protein